MKGCKWIANEMLNDGSCQDIGGAMYILNELNKLALKFQTKKTVTHIVLCAMCAERVGLKKCAGCPKNSEIRYCSRACQVAAWPVHRISCGYQDVEASIDSSDTTSEI